MASDPFWNRMQSKFAEILKNPADKFDLELRLISARALYDQAEALKELVMLMRDIRNEIVAEDRG